MNRIALFRRMLPLVLAACLSACVAPAADRAAQTVAPDLRQRFEARIADEMSRQRIVGLSAAVAADDRITWAGGFGFADRERFIPATTATMYRWASISKPVTAVAALQLIEQGKLRLDDDVRQYVPEFPDKGRTITVRHLLCHQGGIVHYKNGPVIPTLRTYEVENPFQSVIHALDTFNQSPLVAEPGEKYSYTTHGYILLSAVVERAGGKGFADQVAERIADPLGMATFQPDYQWVLIPGRVTGYRRADDGQVVTSTNTDVSWKLGGGGYISSVEDLARFGIGVMTPGRLMRPDTFRQMATPQPTRDGQPTNYGLGLRVDRRDGSLYLSHSGAQEKTATYLLMNANRRLAVALMCNTEGARLESLGADLMKMVEP